MKKKKIRIWQTIKGFKLSVGIWEIAWIAIAIGLFVRVFNLGFPNEKVFDEVYFPVFAHNYLIHTSFFDVHPPFGKFLIAIGIWIFGDHTFGWRIIPALFGIGNVALFAGIWPALRSLGEGGWSWRKNYIGMLIIASFIALDGALIVYSRTGLMDGILFFSIFLSFFLSLKATKPKHLIWLAIVFGLAISIKWVALGVILPIGFVLWRKKLFLPFLLMLPISLIIYQLIVFSGQLIIYAHNPFMAAWHWNKEALDYHLRLKDTHPWSSPWWSWPILKKPVLFYYETDKLGYIHTITGLGNPIVWWSSTLAVAGSVIYLIVARLKRTLSILDHRLTPLLLGYFAFWLPWAPVHRVVFLYHYLPAYGFALLVLVYWLEKWWKKYPNLVMVYVIICIVIGIYFLPFSLGTPLTATWLARHIWVNSWLY